ncbi:MAG: hypothetical protein HY898_08130 [Deltaproteobacteria bacterium]|nr:hypothetical protein [Deltaproteobacteria bacterium]
MKRQGVTRRLREGLGHNVIVASNGREAVECVRKRGSESPQNPYEIDEFADKTREVLASGPSERPATG